MSRCMKLQLKVSWRELLPPLCLKGCQLLRSCTVAFQTCAALVHACSAAACSAAAAISRASCVLSAWQRAAMGCILTRLRQRRPSSERHALLPAGQLSSAVQGLSAP